MSTKEAKKNPAVAYFRESYEELNKVTWPTRAQAIRMTGIVILISLLIAALIGLLDWLFTIGYEQILQLLS
jgi:preprotein translocase subunit SecE